MKNIANRKPVQSLPPANMPRRASRHALHLLLACLATLLALPVNAAVVFPDNPLQTGSAYPPPNVTFILDDSGSMANDFMPGAYSSSEVPATSPQQIQLNAYPRNTLYYNPNTVYLPWLQADGSRSTGGTSYYSAYSDSIYLNNATDLSGNTRTFYVPMATATDLSDSRQYYRYQIRYVGGTLRMVRSQSDGASGASGNWNNQSIAKDAWAYYTANVPAGAITLNVTTSGDKDAWLYVRETQDPTSALNDCKDESNSDPKTCTISNPAPGVWKIGIFGNKKVNNLDISYDTSLSNAGCNSTWTNCTFATPTGRSEGDELTNYATWYSYSRTRTKLAKGAASEAFGQIGSNIRVGYDSIWNRSSYDIPVGTNNGQFTSTNRSTWFARLQGATASGGTPLKGALQRAGKYYEQTGSGGPWGPESGSNQLSCRQSFSILTTDGYWNSDSGYNDPVGDSDAVAGTLYTDSKGVTTRQYLPERPYIDNFTTSPNSRANTLADIANYYWKRDLRTLDNNVPISAADPAFWQHMTTFGLAIGQSGILSPDADDLTQVTNGSKSWPDPIPTENASRIDDLWHAAVNGHGKFVAATDPTKFAKGLVEALATVAERNGSASNVTSNSTSFQGSNAIYQASYISGKWSGELKAFSVDSTNGVAATPIWLASQNIPASSSRNILTWGSGTGTAFPTSAQTSALSRTSGLAQVTGANNASYIKGDRSYEKQSGTGTGNVLRDRVGVLGDIVDSSPTFVKDTQTVYVGANDGMLHAFDALTGVEKFAYVPRGIDLANLASLSDPQYVHKWFVDGPLVATSLAQTPGANYLVGALGRGGNGLFGLNITTPGVFGNSDVMWDMTGSAAPTDMGQVLGEPLIVKLNDGTKAIVTGNGYNSSTGTAALFVINLTTGAVIQELDTGYTTGGNGLSAPRGWDNDGNGTVDYVYAGDLQGNLWKFDFTASTSSSWIVSNSGSPMFVAKDKTNKRQAITAGLALARDPSTGKRWIFIGTGAFLSTGDVTDMSTQTMYGVIDDGSVVTGRTSSNDGDLQKRTIALISGDQSRRGFETHDTLASGKKGWYVDLLTPPNLTAEGERIVSRPQVRGTVLITASIIPPSGETCDAGGRGYINAIDAFSGTSTQSVYFDANGDNDFNNDTIGPSGSEVPIGSMDPGIGMPTLPTIIDDLLVVGGSTSNMGQIKVNPQGAGAKRISWREILRD